MQAYHMLQDSSATTGQPLLQVAQHATTLMVNTPQHSVHDRQLGAAPLPGMHTAPQHTAAHTTHGPSSCCAMAHSIKGAWTHLMLHG